MNVPNPRRARLVGEFAVIVVGVLVALAVLYLVLRMMRRPSPVAPLVDLSAGLSTGEREEYFRRIEAALYSEDGKPARPHGEAQSTTEDGASG